MPEHTVSKFPELVTFGGPLPKSKFSAVSTAIFHANVITGNIWPKIHAQLCTAVTTEHRKWPKMGRNNSITNFPFAPRPKLSSMSLKNNFSKHRPPGPMLSISRFVHLCVCLCVSLCVCSLLRYRLNAFFPPFLKLYVQFFRDSESLGKIKGKKWSQI